MKIISNINPVIFRGYDIRGVSEVDINEDVFYTIGRGYATYLLRRRIKEATVGRDGRLTSPLYAKAFIKGLLDGGINVYDLGKSLSQIVYFSLYELKTKGGAMISASHNPKEFNGIKLCTGYSETMVADDIKEFKSLIERGQFSAGKGTVTKRNVFPSYKKDILKRIKLNRKWRVVVDSCNTVSGLFYPDIFRSAGCDVIEENSKVNGNFPLGVPDPTEESVLKRVARSVEGNNADIGFAYDSDGDRMSVVDEQGNVLWMDTIISLFVKDVLEFLPNSPIVFNALCSKVVLDTIKSEGGQPVMGITGHSFIKAKVRESKSPFGGELSGHIFFMDDFYGHDDGAYSSLRLLSYLERRKTSLSNEVAKLSKYISSPEIKLGVPDSVKFDFIESFVKPKFRNRWSNGVFNEMDGIRVDTNNEMAIIRASQNGPYITIKFEAKSLGNYKAIRSYLSEMLRSSNSVDWNKGVNTSALLP
jgi:phosphomannomutase